MRGRMSFSPLRSTVAIMTVACWLQLVAVQPLPRASAQNAATRSPVPAEANFELRTYDVGDLVVNIQDHPYDESLQRRSTMSPRGGGFGAGGGGFGGGGGFFSVPDQFETGDLGAVNSRPATRVATRRPTNPVMQLCQFGAGMGGVGSMSGDSLPATSAITMDDLMRVLTTTVASDSWALSGGAGQVEPLGTALVIWQTQAVHGRIEELLKQIRQGSADRKTVTIDARWLLLNSDELERLLLPNQEGVPQVDREVLDEFTRRPRSIRGITNCFSSQLVYLVSGTRRNVVSSYIPVVGSLERPERSQRFASRPGAQPMRLVSEAPTAGGATAPQVGYQPIVEKPILGALLEIRPTMMPGKSAAAVDLKSTITVSAEQPNDFGVTTESASLAPEVDRIAIETQQFATTLRIPLGKPILVGGLTHMPGSTTTTNDHQQATAGRSESTTLENPQLYFVLEVR